MPNVTGILAQVITGDVDGAGTDGTVYLGIGGREFVLDSEADDHERGAWREYLLGVMPPGVTPNARLARVRNAGRNDPRSGYALSTDGVRRSPVYIRFEPSGNSPDWNLQTAIVLLYAPTYVAHFTTEAGFDNLWLGASMGKMLYLSEQYWVPSRRLDTVIKDLAPYIGSDLGSS